MAYTRYPQPGTLALAIASMCAALAGCNGRHAPELAHTTARPAGLAAVPYIDAGVRDITPRFHNGHTGEYLMWYDVQRAIDSADVIVLGERHGDAVGHQVQHLVVADVLNRYPGSAVAMEMLERDQQVIVDDYLTGVIDFETYAEQARITGWPDWQNNYQPTVDAARDTASAVVAANAPRRYVSMARLEGYDRLRSLTAEQQRMFDIPPRLNDGDYWRRFCRVMGLDIDALEDEGHAEPQDAEATGDDKDDENGDADDADEPAAAPVHHVATIEHARNGFRSQQLWDATMAGSIDCALHRGATKVVHLNGGFHSDYDGGVVDQLRLLRPRVRVLTITTLPISVEAFRDEDLGRADVVIYTGAIPPESDDASGDAPVQHEDDEPSGDSD